MTDKTSEEKKSPEFKFDRKKLKAKTKDATKIEKELIPYLTTDEYPTVEGVFKGIEERVNKEGEIYNVAVMEYMGESFLYPAGKVLADMLGEVDTGKSVIIDFIGKKKGKKGRTYNNFDVFVIPERY